MEDIFKWLVVTVSMSVLLIGVSISERNSYASLIKKKLKLQNKDYFDVDGRRPKKRFDVDEYSKIGSKKKLDMDWEKYRIENEKWKEFIAGLGSRKNLKQSKINIEVEPIEEVYRDFDWCWSFNWWLEDLGRFLLWLLEVLFGNF